MESLIFALDGRDTLVNDILKETDHLEMGHLKTQKFSDGELCVQFTDSVRGKRVYLLTSPNNSDEIIKLTLAIDAAKRAGANEIIPILPFFPYQRSDKKDQSRGSIGAKVMAEMIEHCGATSLITFELHADQIQGFFKIPVIHIEGKNVFDGYIAGIANENTILSSCDAGGVKRVKRLATLMKEKHKININYVVLDKVRVEANVVESITIIGDVKGKDVILCDDMVDTFGSAEKAIEGLLENGAKSVKMLVTHGVLSGPALDRIGNSKLERLVISNSLPINVEYSHKSFMKIEVINIAKLLALAIGSLNNSTSFSDKIEK